jgi:hypothetical protein
MKYLLFIKHFFKNFEEIKEKTYDIIHKSMVDEILLGSVKIEILNYVSKLTPEQKDTMFRNGERIEPNKIQELLNQNTSCEK